MGYINILYRDYKKVSKRLLYFSPETSCFYETFLSNILHTQYCLSLRDKVFSLFLLHFKLPKLRILNSQIFFWPVLPLLGQKQLFMKFQRKNNKKVTKRDQKQKSNKNGIISLQYKHNFRRLKNTLNDKMQEWRISHAWAMYG